MAVFFFGIINCLYIMIQRHPQIEKYYKLKILTEIEHNIELNSDLYLYSQKQNKNLRSRLSYFLRASIPSPKDQVKVLIIGLPRSGTTYLQTLLASTEDSYIKGEFFSPFLGKYHQDYPKKAKQFSRYNRQKLVGFKFMMFHSPNYETDLVKLQNKGWKIICTQRENLKEQSLSNYLSAANHFFHRTSSNTKETFEKKIINLQLLDQHLSVYKESFDIQQKIISNFNSPICTINFKDFKDKNVVHKKLSDYLNISIKGSANQTLKTYPSLNDVIKNYDEVMNWIHT